MRSSPPPSAGPLSATELRALLRLAAAAVHAAVHGLPLPHSCTGALADERGGGAFVSLHWRAQLAGCVGFVTGPPPLAATVVRAARAAALEDPRFDAVVPAMLDELEVELSVLSEPSAITAEQVRAGEHGLMLEVAGRRGLLLPQVAREHGLSRDAFLRALCDKAGVPPDAWRAPGATLEAFTAQVVAAPARELAVEEASATEFGGAPPPRRSSVDRP